MCSASMSIIVGYLLFMSPGPDHPGCATGNALTNTAHVPLVEHRSLSQAEPGNEHEHRLDH